MTQAQFTSIIQSGVAALGGYLLGHGWDAGLVTFITGTVALGAPLIWGYLSNTKLALAQKAASLDEVAKVVLKPTAGNGLAAAAADPTQPKITK